MRRFLFRSQFISVVVAFVVVLSGCSSSDKRDKLLFEMISSEKSNINFSNDVKQVGENNVLNYSYYFNGGGVAVGDINNDGLMDVYFSGNQVPNKLYLNKGNFVFEDITDKAGVSASIGWKTGVTMADVNLDGWLDIYVCRSAMTDSLQRENLLFINNGDQTFTEKGRTYGVADNSYSTHASFFDYDHDGDLDLFVLNHSVPKYAGFNKLLKEYKNQKGSKFGSKLYRQDEGKFTDVSDEAGIINNVLSFGLGLAVSDINMDGWQDLYISNDFNEEDYLYINQQNGSFKNVIRDATGHVSLFSMGSDVADINNDGRPDIFTLDMMPETNERIKLSSGDDNYDKYQLLINAGFHHQTMRNMLQLNNGDGTFSEIGQLSGISNTDWSWAALFSDFDGDGWKDLFISNGYEKDYTNMQFLKFTVDEQIKARQQGTSPDVQLILDRMPAIEVGNYMFSNNGDLTFSNQTNSWGITQKFKSNGAAYADLDNDGDPDLLINVMNGKVMVYKNNVVEKGLAKFLTIDFSSSKIPVSGTKTFCYTGGHSQYYEFSPDRGYQSCMYAPLHIGVGNNKNVDSVRVVWPDNKTSVYKNISVANGLRPNVTDATKYYQYRTSQPTLFKEVKSVDWKHVPTSQNDFKRQFLLPKMYSYSGPKVASGDVNGDGKNDMYICAPQGQAGSLFIQKPDGNFTLGSVKIFEADKTYHDEDAVFFDADNDGDLDLYVVSGGYFAESGDKSLQDRLYVNDGKGNFTRREAAMPPNESMGSCVQPFDVDNDGDLDLFVGSRMVPGQYPLSSPSVLLINDGKGNFSNKELIVLSDLGMVCDALAVDIDGKGDLKLIVTGEWTAIRIFDIKDGELKEETKSWFSVPTEGWWNCLNATDFDNDGDLDLIAGNYGSNNQFNVSQDRPATLVYKDFDHDNQIDPFFNYYIGDTTYPFASRDEALSQVSFLKPRYTDYAQYSNATMNTMFKQTELQDARELKVDVLKTIYLENKGGRFEMKTLPVEVQFSPVYSIASVDVDFDGDVDLVMGGNESNVRVRLGRSDANRGLVLLNDGAGNFSTLSQDKSGLNVTGDVRSITCIGDKLVFGINNGAARTYQLRQSIMIE